MRCIPFFFFLLSSLSFHAVASYNPLESTAEFFSPSTHPIDTNKPDTYSLLLEKSGLDFKEFCPPMSILEKLGEVEDSIECLNAFIDSQDAYACDTLIIAKCNLDDMKADPYSQGVFSRGSLDGLHAEEIALHNHIKATAETLDVLLGVASDTYIKIKNQEGL
ncbi:MAG: hypothetical protein KBB83_03360 [Alphaproteobacteria bacterium]|nr:hypothetical protein [Alphaproteobacteria bacterium]